MKTAGCPADIMDSMPPLVAPIAVTAETATVTPTSIAEAAALVRRAFDLSCCVASLPVVPSHRRAGKPRRPTRGGSRCWANLSTAKKLQMAPMVTSTSGMESRNRPTVSI